MKKLMLMLMLAAAVGTGKAEAQWSRPVTIMPVPERGVLQTDFEALIDSRDVIHMAYTLGAYSPQDREDSSNSWGDRTMYQQFDIEGHPLFDPIILVDSVNLVTQGRAQLILDSNDNAHIVWSTHDRDWVNQYYYARMNPEGELVVGPSPIDGTLYRHQGNVWDSGDPTFLRRSDGALILAGIIGDENPGDTLLYKYFVYLQFDSTGTTITGPELVWGGEREDPEFSYANGYTSLDDEDNIHFTCRRSAYGEMLYGCVGPDGNIICDLTVVPPAVNPQLGSNINGLSAINTNSIFLFRADNRHQGENYRPYLQKILPNGEHDWFRILFEDFQNSGGGKIQSIAQDDRLFISGRIRLQPREDFYYYLTALDTIERTVDSMEIIMRVPWQAESSLTLVRASDRVIGFYRQGVFSKQINMIQKQDSTLSVFEDLPILSIPKELSVNVFPQPCNSSSQLIVNSSKTGNIKFCLYSIDGREIGEFAESLKVVGTTSIPLERAFKLSELSAGQYILSWSFNKSGEQFTRITITK